MVRNAIAGLMILMVSAATAAAENVTKTHAMSLIHPPQYAPGFSHFDYVNPDAPKGGTLRLGRFGGFDSLNPFVPKGNPAGASGYAVETLMTTHQDEPSTEYGLLAETVEFPDDYSWVIFNLREAARFHDGSPVTADDVAFSFAMLRDQGRPFYRYYYRNVIETKILGPKRIKFIFSEGGNRELPHIMGQLPVLSKAWWEGRDFAAGGLEPIMGSGSYRVVDVQANRQVTIERVPDYWGANLGVKRGFDNFDRVVLEFFADRAALLEGFKGRVYDYRTENSSKDWATGYDFPAARKGDVILEMIPHSRPTGMQAFVYNLRRPVFQDMALRRALAYAFDFEWSNDNLFYGQYTRTESYFSNSELASSGLPSDAELALLEPLRGQIPDAVFTKAYVPPSTAGGSLRKNLGEGFRILKEAGYRFENKKLFAPNGEQVAFEILLVSPQFERIVLPVAENLKRMGVDATVRTVDDAQYLNRIRAYDFDMIVGSFPQSESPGNEQRDFFGSESAAKPAGRNLMGLQSPAIDTLIDAIIFAKDREALVTATRAMDRVLLHMHLVIPQWHVSASRMAWWDKFGMTGKHPKYGPDVFTWWVDPEKAARLDEAYK